MKRAVFTVIMTFFVVCKSNAEIDSSRVKMEVGLNVFQITRTKEIMNGGSYLYKDRLFNVLSGLTFKFRFSKTAIYYSTDFVFYRYKFIQDNYLRSGTHDFQEARIGFEFLLGKSNYSTTKKIIPFGRIDFHLAVGTDKGDKSGVPYNDKIREFGLGPTFGMRYSFNERWSISSEVSGSIALFSYDKIGQYPLIKLIGGYLYLPRFVGVNYEIKSILKNKN